MRATLLNGPNAGKSYSLNWDNRQATPIGGGSGSSIAGVFSGCTAVTLAFQDVVISVGGPTADAIIGCLESLHRGALQPA